MATRARILADYVSSGVTAAEFDFLDTTSGTPGSGTFLRGDKTWVAAGSTSASDLASGTLAIARMASGTVIKVHNSVRDHTSSVYYDSGTNTVHTYNFTPESATNNLFIQTIVTFQIYGNETDTSPAVNIIVVHNTDEIARAYNIGIAGAGNTHAAYDTNTINSLIAVDHDSAGHNARDIIIKLNPTAGRVGIQGDSDTELRNWGPIITVMELA